jgi:TRAP-type C4-dicarboxylate transport system substrate-binding protein
MLRKASALLALIVVSAVASGCAGAPPGDKAGGPGGGPVVLRMASTAGDLHNIPPVAEFVQRVDEISDGLLQIKVINQWGDWAPDAEAQVVRAVAAGTADLGWAGSRALDTIGIPGFRALSAPMLIDSYPLENAVLRSAIPGRMLAGLASVHVTGLGVLGEGLRLPISTRRPLLAPANWRGVSFGTYRSRVQEDAIRALGATPVVAFGPVRSHVLGSGQIQGFELDLRRYVEMGLVALARYVAVNVALWPQFDVLFANPGRFASLTAQQRGWLQQAAKEATTDSVGLASDNDIYIGQTCAKGARFVNATPADLAALRKALSVVYQHLQVDPQTRAFIQQIQRLKNTTPAGPAPPIPAGCTRKP